MTWIATYYVIGLLVAAAEGIRTRVWRGNKLSHPEKVIWPFLAAWVWPAAAWLLFERLKHARARRRALKEPTP